MDKVQIRDAVGADWRKLEKIFCGNRTKGTAWLNPDRPKDNLRKQCEGEKILVAEISGRVLGFISIWEPENFIHHLYIDKDYQGKGIGSKLIFETQKRFQNSLRLKCGEKNKKALEFYFGNGWKEVGKGVSDDGSYLLLELHVNE